MLTMMQSDPKDLPLPEDVTRATNELHALARLIERPPLEAVSLSLDMALRASFAIHKVLAHINRSNVEADLVDPIAKSPATLLSYESMRSFGRCDFDQLREAVYESKNGSRDAPPFDSSYSAGHQMVHGINYNALDRIVTAFVEHALSQKEG
ncbi:hypothetical protein [Sphingomonas glacialis]|uniref:hypothetical protein n=1 Tax=Sphingomonas glacialis TaxID=658225 RepID=UPI001129758D|nr:hypothetical protein [Sphingomonas glacialis]